MSKFDSYKDAFPHAKLTRSPGGGLEVVLHTDGGIVVFDGHTHEEFMGIRPGPASVPSPSRLLY